MTEYGIYISLLMYMIGIISFIFNKSNLIMQIISQEIIQLSIGLLLVEFSFHLEDLIGVNMTLLLLPLAGAESAVALGLLIGYYPIRGTIIIN